jgi:hypothetical protein
MQNKYKKKNYNRVSTKNQFTYRINRKKSLCDALFVIATKDQHHRESTGQLVNARGSLLGNRY